MIHCVGNLWFTSIEGIVTEMILAIVDCFHHGNAVRTLDVLCWILARGYKYCRYNVAGVSIISTKSTCNGRARKVLEHVKLYKSIYVGFQNLLHHLFLDYSLTHN
ncbi:LOW QUALITY PROTEIN: hypothetical protein TorRG33x02_138080 [Trema orientale]|uniref:Uncharacterized protein n=1 Tax=Trema orientale TaxID=63057 RepID=A0A2P5EYA1_TREOI|nr:LOW QUALITY PROTEIN: hypothetical protein TorRG33x02_138080 [Trema orientale]